MYDTITIGAATRDVFLVSDQFMALRTPKVHTGIAECVSLGSKIEVDKIVFTTGGGATNAAATFAQLGMRAATVTRVGDDSAGKDVAEDLSAHGVSTQFVRVVKGGTTAYSTLLTMRDGERTALVHRGVSAAFAKADIPPSIFGQTRWIYLTSLGDNINLCTWILTTAKKAGVKVAWNPGMAEIKKGILNLVPMANVLMMNKEEAAAATGKKSIKQMFKALHCNGLVTVITDGTEGSYVWRDGWMAHAGTTSAKAVSRTGAGDAFGSGFVAAIMKTDNLIDALRVGTLNAESVIGKFGAKTGILQSWPSALKKSRIAVKTL